MRKFFVLLCLLTALGAAGQQKFFMINKTSGGGGSYTVLRTFYLNFLRDVETQASSPWNNTATPFMGWTSAGGVGVTNMTTSTGAASTVSATNPAAITGVGGIVLNTSGANVGVWPDAVIGTVAEFSHNQTYQFTGLDDTKYYNVYVHFDDNHYQGAANVQMTIGGTTTTTRNPNGNHGEGLGSGLANTALDVINAKQSSSGVLTITFTSAAGSGGRITVTSIVLEETNIAKP